MFRKPAEKIKEHHDRAVEDREILRPELERLEEERRQQRLQERERRNAEREQKRAEREQSMESRRRSKFDSIASVTTGAQQEVTDADKKEAARREKETKDPVKEQKKESVEFQKDLSEYLNVKYDGRGLNPKPAFPVDDTPAEPYSPDAPKYADESDDESAGKHLNPVIKHESLFDPALAAANAEAAAAVAGFA